MNLIARLIARTALEFDGVTPETVTGYSTAPEQNVLRTYKSAADTVGAFTTQDLGAPDKERPIALWFRLIGTPNAGTSRVDIKSAFVGDTDAAYVPNALLLESHPLLTTWTGPLTVGPTDRVCPVHDENTACTMEFRSMDLLQAIELGLIDDLTPGAPSADDCCLSSSITVTATSTLDPWNNRLIVFIDPVAVGAIVSLPTLIDVALSRKAVFIYLGEGSVFVAPQAGDQMNGVTNGVFELNGNIAAVVERRETTWTSTEAVLSAGQTLENAVKAATVDIDLADAPVFPVRFEMTQPGFLRLQPLASSGIVQELQLVRNGGTGQAVLIPRAGEVLNGEVDGRFFLGFNEGATVRRLLTGGWLAIGDGAQRPCRTLTLAADATLELWGAGRINVLCTQAGAQTVTLPASPIADGAEANFGCAGAGGLTISGNGANIRSGTGAPAATMAVAQNENARLVWAGTLWIAYLGT